MYEHKDIEDKWQAYWSEKKTYKTDSNSNKEKYYSLSMFPYPSGSGLHLGHSRIYTGADIFSRYKRMQGYEVLQPMGWDAFGLPAEGYAIKNKQHPRVSTEKNINTFKHQISKLGMSIDWDREINTTDPKYYKWTQWIFLQLFKRGLAYEVFAPVNWCPDCKTGLANEDLEQGKCERCGSRVERRPLRQWFLRITDYAERLIDDLDELDKWPEFVKDIQRNWIGKGEGYTIPFLVEPLGKVFEVFTTRPDTLYGCSFLAISPESEYVDVLLEHIKNKEEVDNYRQEAFTAKQDEAEKNQTGVVCEGIHATHPITKKDIPVYVANYVLGGYGTGAIFGSAAHDERDFAFAKKYNLPIIQVVEGDEELPFPANNTSAKIIDSGDFSGLTIEEAKGVLTKAAGGEKKTAYKLHDWLFSRQRYWGEPFPLIHCEKCGVVPVPEDQLPVELPEIESYEPTGTGESPLATIDEWVNVECPKCGGKGKRETNVMPQWAGSSWYHLRYIDPHNDSKFIDDGLEKKWMPVDRYTGGLEHAARHLIYARFWHKVLYDIGLVHTKEPYIDLRPVGLLLSESGSKISKRSGDAADPDQYIESVGSDTLRVFLAYIAPFDQAVEWNSQAIAGPRRFLERVFAMRENIKDITPSKEITNLMHKTILSVTNDIEEYRFNTVVSTLIIYSNTLQKEKEIPKECYETLILLLAPLAPFITEEIWSLLGNDTSIHLAEFPKADISLTVDDNVSIAIQVNGKTRGVIVVSKGSSQNDIISIISSDDRLAKYIEGLDVRAFVEDKIISFA